MEERKPKERKPAAKSHAGQKGGEAAFAAPYPTGHEEVLPGLAATIVRWSPIWMGLLTAVGVYLVLSTLGMAIALSTVEADTRGEVVRDLGRATALYNAIAALIALFVGGLIAGRHGVHAGFRSPWTQGTAVWALYLVAAMITAALGFSAVGMAGAEALGGTPTATAGGVDLTTVRNALSDASVAAWALFAAAVIGWLLAVGGAWLGETSVHRTEHRP